MNHYFKYDGCWLILKDTTKWFHFIKEKNEKAQQKTQRKRTGLDVEETRNSSNPSTPISAPGSATSSINLDDEESPFSEGAHELSRPPGRKASKNLRRKKNDDALNLYVQEFSCMRKDQKEIAEKEIIKADERNRLKIQANQEKERMRIEAKLEHERMKIAAKREKEQMDFDREIMKTDPNSIPTDEGRAWYIEQQKIIWARMMQRGARDGSSGNGV